MRAHTVTSMTRQRRYAWCRAPLLIVLSVFALAISATASAARASASADTVRDWNRYATAAVANAPTAPVMPGVGQPAHVIQLHLAIVQGAVYDAVNAIDGGHQPYLVAPAADPSDSKNAAAATAAHEVLVGLKGLGGAPMLPQAVRDWLDPLYTQSLAVVPDGPAKTAGIAIGEAAASAMLAERADDGRFGTFQFTEGFDAGEWRLGPPQGPTGIVARDPAPWVGDVMPFLVPNVEMLRTDGPNPLTSAAYAEEFNEVKELGSLTSTKRTADQTDAAVFWQDGTIWNGVLRALTTSEDLGIADSARLLAEANLAGADGSIGCWNDKAYWSFWRPITAIREAGSDGNPATEADPAWVPLFNPTIPVSGAPLVTPGFPDHPSGHTCISGAIARALKAFFGTDKMEFTAVSPKCSPAPCPPRSYSRFSDALKEIIDARVWGGIHFRTADVQGAVLGKKVANWLDKHYFQRVK